MSGGRLVRKVKGMPLYTAITEDGFVSDETKAKIAKEITQIHTTIMKVPAGFVRVAFLSYPKGSGYTAGKAAPTAALNCVLRNGHTDEDKTEMLKQLWSMFQSLTDSSASIWLPARVIVVRNGLVWSQGDCATEVRFRFLVVVDGTVRDAQIDLKMHVRRRIDQRAMEVFESGFVIANRQTRWPVVHESPRIARTLCRYVRPEILLR